MANYRAVANGNWSALATWQDNSTGSFVASTQLPGVNDDVYANNFTVSVDQNISVQSISNLNTTGITAGGRFDISTSITVTSSSGVYSRQITAPTMGPAGSCVYIKTAGISVIINSDLYSSGGLIAGGYYSVVVCVDVASTVNINGSINGGTGVNSVGLFVSAAATINITGNINAGTTVSSQGIRNQGGATYNITGNQFASTAPAIISTVTATFIITGSQFAGTAEAIINTAANAVLSIVGTCQASAAIAGITNTQSSCSLSYSGTLINVGKIMAINSSVLWFDPIESSSYWQFVGANQVTTKTLYAAGTGIGNPASANVRQGTTYGPSDELTGTLAVPPAAAVGVGVPVDNTVGTALTTAEAIRDAVWNALTEDLTEPNSIGARLKNASTVETTGEQIAGFNI